MRPCFLAPFFALFASAGPSQAAPALTVHVRDAIPSGVMMAVAGAMQKNILTVDMDGSRLTLDGSFDSADAFFQAAAGQIKAKASLVKNFHVLRPACQKEVALPRPPLPLALPITIGFQKIPASSLINIIFSGLYKIELTDYDDNAAGGPPWIGIHVVDGKTDEILQLLAAFSGVAAQPLKGLAFRVGSTDLWANCPRPFSAFKLRSAPAFDRSQPCPRAKGGLPESFKRETCELLEYVSLDAIKLRGYLDVDGKKLALLETPDANATISVEPGSRLGLDAGTVVSIDDSGLVVEETRLGADGYLKQSRTHIGYNNERKAQPMP